MPSINIKCKDCPTEFEFTEGEQEFYEKKGFSQPTRCKPCREKNKQKKESGGGQRGKNR